MRVLISVFLFAGLSSCWMFRAYKLRNMNLEDHKKLPSVRIHKPDTAFYFHECPGRPCSESLNRLLDSELLQSRTAAFLVIRNDSILYERYFDGFDRHSLLPSNSMAKSFTGTLVSIAIEEGKIRGTKEPVTTYLPELLKNDRRFSDITIQHLLDMRSGIDFNEGRYDLKDDAIRLGLSNHLEKRLLKARIAEPPGRFRYQSINTQLLSLIIERATGRRLYEYFEDKLWKPWGAEQDATWNVDSKRRKQALASAGLNAIPRDFAKLGRLYLQKGVWEENRILSEDWVNTIANTDTMNYYGGYKNQWWSRQMYITFQDSTEAIEYIRQAEFPGSFRENGGNYRVSTRNRSFSAIGFLNQSIYVNADKNLIIVRIGKRWHHRDLNAIQFIHYLAGKL